jgi:tetratricopeptide (TPR) repeat protein
MSGRNIGACAWAALCLAGCSLPPWQIGAPLNGHPSIPPYEARLTPREARETATRERAFGHQVLELGALGSLAQSERLAEAETARLCELLYARAESFRARGRAAPWSRDLERLARLDPAAGQRLVVERAAAAAAAGDAWKAIGARGEAQAAFDRAALLGGVARAWTAEPLPPPAAPPATLPSDLEGWVLAEPALSTRLLPLSAAFPAVLDDRPRALRWVEILLDEDPSSPDVLEVAALVFGRAGRFGGTDRMLMELTFHTPDRAAGLARGAAVWDRLGRPREACAQWIRAARWRDEAEDPNWGKAIACTRKDPGAGDWREIRAYVLQRARPEQRDALATALDAS